jgi:hypothetical protein
LSEYLKFSFAEKLPGTVWRTLADPDHKRLFIEIRNSETKQVAFSAFDLETARWLWKEKSFDEPWWISLAGVSSDVLLLTVYTDTHNPDKKSVLAFEVKQEKILWWKNDFSIASVFGKIVTGVESKWGHREVVLDIFTGNGVSKDSVVLPGPQNFHLIRPFHYQEGSTHFDTVKSFLEGKGEISPVFSVEYCEHHSLILISAFSGREDLVNYLIVFNSKGEIVMKETLGEHLKGIASDTFFIFSGYLVFVKNTRELVCYKLV